jgi:hypothetical protein
VHDICRPHATRCPRRLAPATSKPPINSSAPTVTPPGFHRTHAARGRHCVGQQRVWRFPLSPYPYISFFILFQSIRSLSYSLLSSTKHHQLRQKSRNHMGIASAVHSLKKLGKGGPLTACALVSVRWHRKRRSDGDCKCCPQCRVSCPGVNDLTHCNGEG